VRASKLNSPASLSCSLFNSSVIETSCSITICKGNKKSQTDNQSTISDLFRQNAFLHNSRAASPKAIR
ncbi:MAG: hypothetical protein MSS87_02675, partial [Bacteroidales bacterium]|nr:hypothetical protein [Bacteroidales bacterium]